MGNLHMGCLGVACWHELKRWLCSEMVIRWRGTREPEGICESLGSRLRVVLVVVDVSVGVDVDVLVDVGGS